MGVALGGANYNQIKQSLCQYKDSVVQLVIVVGIRKRSSAATIGGCGLNLPKSGAAMAVLLPIPLVHI